MSQLLPTGIGNCRYEFLLNTPGTQPPTAPLHFGLLGGFVLYTNPSQTTQAWVAQNVGKEQHCIMLMDGSLVLQQCRGFLLGDTT